MQFPLTKLQDSLYYFVAFLVFNLHNIITTTCDARAIKFVIFTRLWPILMYWYYPEKDKSWKLPNYERRNSPLIQVLEQNLDNTNQLLHSKHTDRKNQGMCWRKNQAHGTQALLWYIYGSWWPGGLGICLVRRGSWVQFLRQHIPQFFLSGCLLCGSRFALSRLGCNTLGWSPVPSFLFNIFS